MWSWHINHCFGVPRSIATAWFRFPRLKATDFFPERDLSPSDLPQLSPALPSSLIYNMSSGSPSFHHGAITPPLSTAVLQRWRPGYCSLGVTGAVSTQLGSVMSDALGSMSSEAGLLRCLRAMADMEE